MNRLYGGTFICCLAFLIVIIAPAGSHAQAYPQSTETDYLRSRAYTEDAYMGWNTGKSWRDIMDEFQNQQLMESDYRTFKQERTYALTALDDQATGKAICWEQLKQVLVDDVADQISGRSGAAKNVSKKVYGKASGISYELLPDRDAVALILRSLILIQETSEGLQDRAMTLQATTRLAPSRIVRLIIAVGNQSSALQEMDEVRRIASDAMDEIMKMQAAGTGSGAGSDLKQRYTHAANRLTLADQLERGRYHALNGETQPAVDAYGKALEISPGLAIAYRNRGGIRLHLEQYAEAISDFLRAHTNDAIDHLESGDFKACIQDTEAALKLAEEYLTKGYGPAYYQRGVCQVGMKQQDLAMADFKKAAQLGDKRAQKLLSDRGIAW